MSGTLAIPITNVGQTPAGRVAATSADNTDGFLEAMLPADFRTMIGLGSAAVADAADFATPADVSAAVAALVDSSPAALDTLNELAAALGDDPNFATTITTALAGKSAVGHGHAIADVTNLQTTLDGKSAVGHGHVIGDVTNLQTMLDGKSAVGHTHIIANVTGLQTELDSKADPTESHNWTAPQIAPPDSVAFAATIVDDTSSGSLNQKLTLTGDVTSFTMSNGSEGQRRVWYILQDGTGGHTVTFSGIDGTEPTIDTTANALTVVEMEYVAGTGWRFV
ncbi:MAG: hypothetical protein Fues2KO_47240 [Fuerstiella sp.]